MTQLQELKQKIIKYVPEIMELKKGCFCKFKDGGIAMITKVEYGGYLSAVNGGAMKMVSKDVLKELSLTLQAVVV